MKVFSSVETGFYRCLKSWKGVLIIWFVFLMLVSVFAVPLKGALKTAFGSSMITEKLSDGFNLEIFTDLGVTFRTLITFLTSGFVFILLIGFIINSFLTAGLFTSLKREAFSFSAQEFFRAGARNFWSFLVITLMITLIINLSAGVFIGIPVMIARMSETISEKTAFIVNISAVGFFLLILPIFLLVADYARAWKAVNENVSGFKALGFGFSQTFSKFRSSYMLMLVMIIIQILLSVIIIKKLPGWRPVTFTGLLLFIFVSQFLFYIRLLFKAWRYASVTVLMEQE